MSKGEGVIIRRLPTGVPGLDSVLGGGLPEFSFNLVAGQPGTGKTTLSHQIMFANASADRRAIYFTVLGEPTLKMLRYQQQFTFFDLDKLGDSVHFVNLSEAVLEGDFDGVYREIVRYVEEIRPGILVVDSFRTIVRAAGTAAEVEVRLQSFLQRLALFLTSWEATTFLVGEYSDAEIRGNPVFTVADGILWMFQEAHGSSIVRKLQVMKIRGQAPTPGLHSFRITDEGIRVFPRIVEIPPAEVRPTSDVRVGTGVTELDEMMGGGIPAGDAVLVTGPAGSGKTLLATQFIAEGLRRGEAGVIVIFEEFPGEYLARAERLGMDPDARIAEGKLVVIRLRPLDLSVDEVLQKILAAVRSIDAQRVVIDSLSGFEVGLAPTYRPEIRESLYRMVSSLTSSGVTVLMTTESAETFAPPQFTRHAISFLTDDIIIQRFIELNGYIERVIDVVKMRRSDHSRALRLYDVTPGGLVIGDVLRGYDGIVTGVPTLRGPTSPRRFTRLSSEESAVLEALAERREATFNTLKQRTGLTEEELVSILRRLVSHRYVSESDEAGTTLYRFEAPPNGEEPGS